MGDLNEVEGDGWGWWIWARLGVASWGWGGAQPGPSKGHTYYLLRECLVGSQHGVGLGFFIHRLTKRPVVLDLPSDRNIMGGSGTVEGADMQGWGVQDAQRSGKNLGWGSQEHSGVTQV